jgi:hypothetical protein
MSRTLGFSLAAVPLLYLVFVFGSRYKDRLQPVPERGSDAEFLEQLGPDDGKVRITLFYAVPRVITEGEAVSLCYSVQNAVAVDLQPPSGDVAPSWNRCLQISPKRDTTYSFTATGADGSRVSESLTIRVLPDPGLQPRILELRAGDTHMDRGRVVYVLHFKTENAQLVRFEPAVVPPSASASGKLYVFPRETTTYTLVAEGKNGRTARKSITLPGDHGH